MRSAISLILLTGMITACRHSSIVSEWPRCQLSRSQLAIAYQDMRTGLCSCEGLMFDFPSVVSVSVNATSTIVSAIDTVTGYGVTGEVQIANKQEIGELRKCGLTASDVERMRLTLENAEVKSMFLTAHVVHAGVRVLYIVPKTKWFGCGVSFRRAFANTVGYDPEPIGYYQIGGWGIDTD